MSLLAITLPESDRRRIVANAITETRAASGLFANTEPNSTGRGGDIQITTGQLTV